MYVLFAPLPKASFFRLVVLDVEPSLLERLLKAAKLSKPCSCKVMCCSKFRFINFQGPQRGRQSSTVFLALNLSIGQSSDGRFEYTSGFGKGWLSRIHLRRCDV